MAARTPGPVGYSYDHLHLVDPGILARAHGRSLPGPAGLAVWHAAPNQVKQATKVVKPGITVNPGSRISGQDWKAKIDASQSVPDYFKKQITWKNDEITTPKKFKYPSDVIEKAWLEDWLSAFTSGDWEISTHHLEVKAEASGKVTETVVPHLSKGEGVAAPLTKSWSKLDDIELTLGWTFESGKFGAQLTSGRGLILIATDIQLSMTDGKRTKTEAFQVMDEHLVRLWFHEIAVHAGRITTGKPSGHGNLTVDSNAKDIDDMFPKSKIVTDVANAIKAFKTTK
jgi:hypothetical protein